MSYLDQRVREAFDEVKVPESVKNQTLACIEAARCAAEAPVPAPVGSSSEKEPSPRSHFRAHGVRRVAALAACLVLAVACLSGYRLYAEPTAYVGIDVNRLSSISVNRFGLGRGGKGAQRGWPCRPGFGFARKSSVRFGIGGADGKRGLCSLYTGDVLLSK